MDAEDKTWHVGRSPRPPPHVRQGPSPILQKGHSPHFIFRSVSVGQTAGWIKMSLGTEVALSPGDIVLDDDPTPSQKRWYSSPTLFGHILWPNGWMDQDATW